MEYNIICSIAENKAICIGFKLIFNHALQLCCKIDNKCVVYKNLKTSFIMCKEIKLVWKQLRV